MTWFDYIKDCIVKDSEKNKLSSEEKKVIVTFLLDYSRSTKSDEAR
jgi:hypothetical protein